MALDYIIKVSVDGADKIDQTTEATSGLADAAQQATGALSKLGQAGAAAGQQTSAQMSETTEVALAARDALAGIAAQRVSEIAMLERIRGPMAAYQADLKAAVSLVGQGKLSVAEYEAELARLQDRQEAIAQYSMTPELRRQADLLDQATGPLRRYEQELIALSELLAKEQLDLEQYDAALAQVQRRAQAAGVIAPVQGPAFDPSQAGRGISDELQREQALLEQIQAPLREYEAQLRTLDSLLKQDAINLDQYNDRLAKATKQAEAAGAIGPVQGPKQQTAAGAGEEGTDLLAGAWQAVSPQLGMAGSFISKFASGGVIAAGAAVALGAELVKLGDEYAQLEKQVERFTNQGESAGQILRDQYNLSLQLKSSLASTVELYAKVRSSTVELNLSQREQMELTKDIGESVAAEGKSAEAAASLTQRLSLAFSAGTINGRELRSIMREYPEIAEGFTTALGKSRLELLQMANKGEISAQQLVDAFKKMAPEVEEVLARMPKTASGSWQHFKDDALLTFGEVKDAIFDVDISAVNEFTSVEDLAAQQQAQNAAQQALRIRMLKENQRELNAEIEKNAKLAPVVGAANSLGINVGAFDQDAADSVSKMRIAARLAGIDIADAFAQAKDRAQLYANKVDEIREQHAAKDIADDAKRIYDALYGVDDLLKQQRNHWRDLREESTKLGAAISNLQANRLVSGAPQSQDERDLILQQKNTNTDLADAQYGKQIVTYAQGLNTARAELEALNRAAKDGVISGEALRQKQDQLITTLNDGRLPEAIKIMEGLTLPVQQAARDFAALNALLRQGRIDISDYAVELDKIVKTGKNGDALVVSDGIARLHETFEKGLLTLSDYDAAVVKLVKDFNTLHTSAGGIQYRIAPQGPEGPAGILPPGRSALGLPSATDNADVRGVLAQVQSATLVPEMSDGLKAMNEQLARANALANEFVAPSVKYEQRIKDINAAVGLNGFTEDLATAARRRAKETLNQENEALEAQKGPIEAYNAALKKLNDQLEDHAISPVKYAEGIDKAKETMLQATGAAQTFSGALQLNWIKMKQDANSFGATVANLAVNDFGKLNDAIVTTANGGAVSWTQMADSMIQDLERIFLKMEETKLVGYIGSLFGSGAADAAGGSASAAGAATDTGYDVVAAYGYANGGSFMVGGQGGIDSKYAPLKLTPGELVTVQTPGQQSASVRSQQAPQQVIVQPQIHNHYDSSMMVGAIVTPNGQNAVLNVMRANAPAIRSALGIR